MRILVDANIIISAGLFPESNVGRALAHIVETHSLVLYQYTLDELKSVFKKKFPERIEYLNKFVRELTYELVEAELMNHNKYPEIRDSDDLPVLGYAIESKVNVLLTGDKDFDGINIGALKIMNPRKYIDEYMK